MSSLNNGNISNKHTLTRRNKFDALQEIYETLTPNDEYEYFIRAHMEVAAKCITTKIKAKNTVPYKTQASKEKRDNEKTAFLCNKRDQLMSTVR